MNESAPETRAASPREVFSYTTAVTLALVMALLTVPYSRCSPFHGLLALALMIAVMPWLVLPLLAIPGALALLVARLIGRTGSQLAWRRVLWAAVGLLIVAHVVATVASIGAPSNSCDLS